MVDWTPVRVEQRDRVAWLILDRPERRNAIGTATVRELIQGLQSAEADHAIGAVVISGSGPVFSAGADLKEFHDSLGDSATQHWESGQPWFDLFSLIPTLAKPVVAAVNGPAIAGGCGLVAVCDMAIASESATFATPEINIGLFPLFILPALIRAVGRRQAAGLALSGRTIDAREAERIGLVNMVAPSSEFEPAVCSFADNLANKMPFTMSLGKRTFARIADLDYASGLELARAVRGAFLASDDLRRGTESFLKR